MVRYLGLADETVFGTPVTPPTTFLDCLSIGLHPEREIVEVESSALIGNPASMAAASKVVGDIEIIPSSENIAKLLKFLFGSPDTSQDGVETRYTHEYLPSDTLKYGTYYKVDSIQPDGLNCLQIASVIPTEVRLEAALNAPVSMTFSHLGQKEAKVSLPTLGTIPSIRQFFSLEGKVYWDIAQTEEETNIDSVSLTYRRAIPDDFYVMNDSFLQGFIPGMASIEGSLDILFKSWDAYEKFWGQASGPKEKPDYAALDVDFKGAALGGTGEYEFHRMRWQLPAIRISSVNDPFERRDKIVQSCDFKGARGTIGTDTTIVKVTLANTMATP